MFVSEKVPDCAVTSQSLIVQLRFVISQHCLVSFWRQLFKSYETKVSYENLCKCSDSTGLSDRAGKTGVVMEGAL